MQDLLIGRRADGRPFRIPSPDRLEHVLIGGKTGTGKSVLMSAIAAELAAHPAVALLGVDLKLMELAFWRPRLTALANTADEASLLLANTVELIDYRNQFLTDLGLREWETRFGPWVIVFIDELARLAGVAVERLLEQARTAGTGTPDPKLFRSAKEALTVRLAMIEHIVAVGRAAGVRLVAATQYPTADVVDPQIRSQMGMRFMLRVISREQVKVILGDGNEQHITPASIPVAERGGFWCVGNPTDPRPARGRSLLLTDATLKQRFADTTCHRIDQAELFAPIHRRPAGVRLPLHEVAT